MRALILMSLASLMLALPAAAKEKALDAVDIKPRTTGFQPLAGTFSASSPTYDRIYGGAADAGCGAPAWDSLNDGTPYDIFCVEVTDTGPIEIIVDPAVTNIADTVLTLYCDPFDPLAPAANVVAFDDDDGVGTLSALSVSDDIHLVPGLSYWIVVSTYGAGMHGFFTVQLGDNILPCGGVGIEATSWGGLKGMYR